MSACMLPLWREGAGGGTTHRGAVPARQPHIRPLQPHVTREARADHVVGVLRGYGVWHVCVCTGKVRERSVCAAARLSSRRRLCS
eukprot:797624-Prymnesium_polylepis.2